MMTGQGSKLTFCKINLLRGNIYYHMTNIRTYMLLQVNCMLLLKSLILSFCHVFHTSNPGTCIFNLMAAQCSHFYSNMVNMVKGQYLVHVLLYAGHTV